MCKQFGLNATLDVFVGEAFAHATSGSEWFRNTFNHMSHVSRGKIHFVDLRNSHEFVHKDARTIEFGVSIPKDGEVTVEYLVRYNR